MSTIDIQKLIDLLGTEGINSKEIVSNILKKELEKQNNLTS